MSNKILVVEDDAEQRMLIVGMLEALGYPVMQAASGRAAASILQKDDDIRLVLTDYAMPEMNGMELLDLVQRQHPHMPVIMLTGMGDVTVAVNAARRGAKDFLTKPPEVGRLQVSVYNAMKLGELEREITRLRRQKADASPLNGPAGHDGGLSLFTAEGLPKTMDALEREIMQAILRHCGRNISKAAAALNIARSTFYRKIGER